MMTEQRRIEKMHENQEELCVCPTFNSYSSDKLAIAARVTDEMRTESNTAGEKQNDDDDFEFSLVREDPEIYYTGQIQPIFPIFNRDLLFDDSEGNNNNNKQSSDEGQSSEIRIPLKNLFLEERDPPSSSSSEADELENVPPGTYCVWRPKTNSESPNRCKKSNSTGSASRRWKFLDLLRRSNSDVQMCSLQLYSSYGGFDQSHLGCSLSSVQKQLHSGVAFSSSFFGTDLCLQNGGSFIVCNRPEKRCLLQKKRVFGVFAMSSTNGSAFKMNLNEYLVTLEKPLGLRFAISVDGKVFVHALKKGGNAEKARIVMVGDTLKKASETSGGKLIEIKDFGDAEKMMMDNSGSCSLVFERPFSPFPVHQLFLINDLDILFNRGRVSAATWNSSILVSNLQTSDKKGNGNSGFVTFSPKYLSALGWKHLIDQEMISKPKKIVTKNNSPALPFSPLVALFCTEEAAEGEWAHGSFPLEEYVKALDRSKGELHYNHSLGMHYNKITEQIYVGSCIQSEADVETLATVAGVTAVLNFQSATEAGNWGINSKVINDSCQQLNILMINYPIREQDSFDMRKKLPFCVGLLLRLVKKNHRVYVTCTTGLDRSPACAIAYLHWMTDISLHAAYNYVTGLHLCKPDRAAIAWATWDLIAMVEDGTSDLPATHAVTFVWNGHEGDDVSLVGDFTGNWKEPIKAVHKGGPRHEIEVRLRQGKYYYKYIVSGQWRHSTASPTERDESGNVNNVITIGDVANVWPSAQQQNKKDANVVKVIERPLTEDERFLLAKAARCIAFSICPIRLAPK